MPRRPASTSASPTILTGGNEVSGFIELDFLTGPGGDERITNSYNPRIRHAFNSLQQSAGRSILVDVFSTSERWPRTWISSAPRKARYSLASPQLRYTSGAWEFAVENPENYHHRPVFGGGGRIVTDTAYIPDIVARYTHSGDWGNFVVAGLGRQLSIDTDAGTERTTGLGLSVSGKFNLGRNDLRWMVSGGPRYRPLPRSEYSQRCSIRCRG